MTTRKGILLAGGTGSRLFPMTLVVNKQLLPVYDKPMVYYPLSVLMLAGIQEVLVISTPADLPRFQALLGTGEALGMRFQYLAQLKPAGISEALILGADFIGNESVALILGDNIFYGDGLPELLRGVTSSGWGATIFAYHVRNPQAYGVVEFGPNGEAVSIEEKPSSPRSNYAVTGLYFYDASCVARARSLKPSGRGELEITDLNRSYLAEGRLDVVKFGRGYAWLDTGTPEAMIQAAAFIHAIEQRQGFKIGCIEEIAWRQNWIDDSGLSRSAERYPKSEYGQYLVELLNRES
jgi:glucose-1-phosphate thymidylyltransferase